MKTKQVVIRFGQLVTFLFADRGLALASMAPPEGDANGFTLWFAKVLTLIVLVLLSSLLQKQEIRRQFWLWISVGVVGFIGTAAAGLGYQRALDDKTFEWPPTTGTERYIAGSVWQPEAQAKRDQTGWSPAKVVDFFGGPAEREHVWTHDSIVANGRSLMRHFLVLALLIATTVFGLAEGALVQTRGGDVPPGPPPRRPGRRKPGAAAAGAEEAD